MSQVVSILETGVFDRHLTTLKAEHRRRRDAMVHAIRQHVPPGALRFNVPDGGMYLWCRLGPRVRARAVQDYAARESVVVVNRLSVTMRARMLARAASASRKLAAKPSSASYQS